MIKANELRIGNVIMFFNEMRKVVSVELWSEDTTGPCIGLKPDGIGYIPAEQDEVEGVQLTAELLLQCGFKSEYGGCYLDLPDDMNDSRFSFNESTGKCLTYIPADDSGYGIEMHFLHEVQNRFFSLAGRELEINL